MLSPVVEPPDLSDEFESGAEDACDGEYDALREDRDEKKATYDAACVSYNAPCRGGLGPFDELTEEEQADLDQKSLEYNVAQQKVDTFNWDKCVDENAEKLEDDFNEQMGDQDSGNGDGMTPKKVDPEYKNGTNDAQILAIATGNQDSLTISPNGLRIGAWKNVEIETPETARFALAQAEFFYDCPGKWSSNSCNGPNADDSEAMWNFAWRARLRRYNRPFGDMMGLAEVLAGADQFRLAAEGVDTSSMGWANASLALELTEAVSDAELFIH